ncbi:MAG: peptidylprolyl isomerase [Candidatus Glassbacteria bacterium]
MSKANYGDTVLVHYEGKLEDGTVFDSSIPDQPLEITLGESKIIPGFENAVVGMVPGESITVIISSDEAYGRYKDELVMKVDRSVIPSNLNIESGQRLQMKRLDGETVPVTVIEISDKTVTLDANHPLAGKNLIFDIKLVKVCL